MLALTPSILMGGSGVRPDPFSSLTARTNDEIDFYNFGLWVQTTLMIRPDQVFVLNQSEWGADMLPSERCCEE